MRTYQHVMLPTDTAKLVRKTHLMSESEWRNLGIQQSQGWVHYMIHEPERHILLSWHPLPKKPKKGSWQAAFQPQALHSSPYFLTSF
uniref:Cyclin-dependent kinases regulatory subunit n=1 Tax=Mandrillus leucophaeus TaxID=9568 RepID=A0A2K5YNB6_MANLE